VPGAADDDAFAGVVAVGADGAVAPDRRAGHRVAGDERAAAVLDRLDAALGVTTDPVADDRDARGVVGSDAAVHGQPPDLDVLPVEQPDLTAHDDFAVGADHQRVGGRAVVVDIEAGIGARL